ncbi:MAG: hypothetical protein KF851_15120 [Pirellulaceae bacterium]|nr:hypothetical protein [Pirellulaceae bacterium]
MNIPKVEFATIPQYLQAMIVYPNLCWIYRGQADGNWPLKPKAGRPDYFLPELDGPDHRDLPPRDLLRFYYWRESELATCSLNRHLIAGPLVRPRRSLDYIASSRALSIQEKL